MTSIDESHEQLERKLHKWKRSQRIGLPSLGLRNSERRLLLGALDVFLLNAALVLSLILRTDLLPELSAIFGPIKWFVTLTIVWFFVANIFDVYDLARASSTTTSMRTVATVALITSSGYLAIPWFTPPIQNRTQAFLFVFLAVLFLTAWRALYAQLFVQPTFQRRALIVGAGKFGQALVSTMQSEYARLDANPFRGTGYTLLGFIEEENETNQDMVADLPVLGHSQDLVQIVKRFGIDEVIIAIPNLHQMSPMLFEAVLDCRELGVPVTKMPTVYERLTSRVPVEYTGGDIEIAAGIKDNPFLRLYAAFKRLSDALGALLALPVLLVIMPVVAVCNLINSPGPLFYKQIRIGYGGRPFLIFKFRTMIPDAETKSGAVWAQTHDDRITPIGKWLRWSHLDELPQILNVLRGEMSLVGPRPERPEFVCQLSKTIPFYRARHSVKPGITGWAQIHQDYGDSLADAQEKLEYDLYYIKHTSPMLDLLIMLRTVTTVIGLRGR